MHSRQIAFMCHPYHRGGVTRWMADAAIAFSLNGHEVYFITVEPAKEFYSAPGRETMLQLLQKEPTNVKIIKAPAGYEFELGTQEYRIWIYQRLLAKIPAGTPVILSDDDAVWAAAVGLHATYPVVGVMHADENYYYNLAAKYWQRVAIIACVSERVKETTRTRIPGFDEYHLFTIPCGINLPLAILHEHSGDILKLVFVGRISEYQKRAGDLLKIAEALVTRGVKFHLDIIGDGPQKVELEQAAAEKNLGNRVAFTGWLSQREVANYLSQSDILLLTSDFEGTPIAMMEALAAGCGMVGTRVSGIEDYEDHPLAKDCLGIYDVGDIEEAIGKILAVATVPSETRQIAARSIAEKEFSLDVCLRRYEAAMNTITYVPSHAPAPWLSGSSILYSRGLAAARQLKLAIKSNSRA